MTSATDWIHGKITDQAIEVLRSRCGTMGSMSPETDPYSRVSIIGYMAGYGDDNPLYWDEDYAAPTRWAGVTAPPRMLLTAPSLTPRSVQEPVSTRSVTFMGEDVLQGVFAMVSGSRTVFERPVRIGDRLRSQSGPHEVIERQSKMAGRALELVNKVAFYNQRDELVATSYDSVIRMERGAARDNRKYLDIPEARYTPEEMEALSAHYRGESSQRRGGQPRYWEDTEVGDDLVKLAKGPLTITDITAYFMARAGARHFYTNRVKHLELKANPSMRLVNPDTNIEDNWVAAHWDEDFARLSGIPRAYDEGAMRYDNLAHVVTDWMGDDAALRELSVTLRKPSLIGDLSWCTGKVGAKRIEGDRHLVDLNLWITNQRDERTALGAATVELPSRQNAAS